MGIIVALSVGIILPVILSTSVGIVTLAMGRDTDTLVIGVLSTSFASAAIGGSVILSVLLGRRARISRLQTDLLTNMTHELRTPLAAIRMYAQTLQLNPENPELTADCLETIVRETEWLDSMIEKVLSWRAASRDRTLLEFTNAPITGAVSSAINRFSRMVAPGDAELMVQVDSASLVCHDPEAICSILLNLLINAYKYTLSEEKQISVYVYEEGGKVYLQVKDNGIGIPPKLRKKIFKPFYRVDSTLRSTSSGTGLGLAIVYFLVISHGGAVRVDPTDEGSRFTISIPLATKQVMEPKKSEKEGLS